MKNFKFRAWDKDHKYMEYTDKNLVVCFSDEGVEVTDHTTFSHSCTSMEKFELMQSTGLKDINGTEIYEGDIIDKRYHNIHTYDDIGVVEFGKGYDSDGWAHGEWFGWVTDQDTSLADVYKVCTVLGNKYENPELLEGK